VVLWVCYERHLQGVWRWLTHGWFALIGVSVLTTYQHHFVDVPTGARAGWVCVWLWPLDRPSPLFSARLTTDPARRRLALRYGVGAAALFTLAFAFGGAWLWLIWPAVAVLMVALNYLLFGASGFQKREDGRLSPAVRWLLAPYLAAAWINSRLWTRKHPQPDQIMDDVWLGRIPTSAALKDSRFSAVLDLCAELSMDSTAIAYRTVPVLDLTAPTVEQCLDAAQQIEHLRQHGPVLVCCALGYSRSATAVAAWLLSTGRADSVNAAIAQIQRVRPRVVLHKAHRQALGQISAGFGEWS
jgi:protein-tyrosine phosphatase